jgi:hypothetical protein
MTGDGAAISAVLAMSALAGMTGPAAESAPVTERNRVGSMNSAFLPSKARRRLRRHERSGTRRACPARGALPAPFAAFLCGPAVYDSPVDREYSCFGFVEDFADLFLVEFAGTIPALKGTHRRSISHTAPFKRSGTSCASNALCSRGGRSFAALINSEVHSGRVQGESHTQP